MDPDTVDVVFRVFRGDDSEVFALFPGLPGTNNPGTCSSYARIGQHSSADPAGCIQRSRPATPEEYAPLMEELTRIGYKLRPVKRCTARHYQRRKAVLMVYGS